MSTQIIVPQLGESVVEARVARWLKQEGDRIEVGEPVVELETDKIDLEVGAERGGVLAAIRARAGADVAVGDVLGVIDEQAAAQPAGAPAPGAPAGSEPRPAPEAKAEAAPAPARGAEAEGTGKPGRPRATPTAKTIARAHTLDLSGLEGSGVGGRITKRDVESHLEAQPPRADDAAPARAPREAAAPAPAREPEPSPGPHPVERVPAAPPTRTGDRAEERVRMSKRRLTIARNLVEAQRTAAMLTTFNEVDMSAVMRLRARQKETFKKRYGVSLGITSFFVKAAVAALQAFPNLNAEIDGDEVVLKRYYDIGIAVGAERGLVVPVIRDADGRSFADIEQAISDFAARAAASTLTLEDLRGGTFTITNGGVFGSLLSTPILNPPQVGILGLHKIEERPIAIKGEMSIRPMMYVALTYDHRLVDGLEAVQFLVRVKELTEDPGQLLLES